MNETFQLEDVLNVLIELETQGNQNYLLMASQTDDPKLGSFFEILANQEIKHKAIYEGFKKEFVNFKHSEITDEYQEYISVLLESTIRFIEKHSDINDLLLSYDMAITLEKDTILMLNEFKNFIPKSRHEDIDKLMNEERTHLKWLYQNPIL